MIKCEITLSFSDDLARQAEAEGLLDPVAIAQLIEAELGRRQRIKKLFDSADRLSSLDMPSLSEQDVETEIQAARNPR